MLEEQAKQLAGLLKLLANENRLMILCLLIEGPKSVGRLSAGIPRITQPALSQHLALLRAHGIVQSAKSGQTITYRIADSRIENVIDLLKQHYCKGGNTP